MKILRSHKELDVYQLAFKTSMEIYHLTKTFPKDEIFSLTSQIRRSSRSVSANISEAFRKRRYEKAFVAKLSDSEAESAETQVWLDYSLECEYIYISPSPIPPHHHLHHHLINLHIPHILS